MTASAPSSAAPCADLLPLYVDLDGTLTPSDTLHESVMRLARQAPLQLLRLPLWLAGGKAALKQQLGDHITPDPATLPWREDLIDVLRAERTRGRAVVLASASDIRTVRAVAEHLGCFTDVLGTEPGGPNLSRQAKRAAIERHARGLGFERWAYVGNSRDDLPVWDGAAEAWAVNAPANVLQALRADHPQARVFEREPLTLRTVLKAIRLKQWAKNALLFVPLLAAHSLDPAAWTQALLAFLAFGLCASATYLVNDLLDLPSDRVHRIKRHRPLAAGRLGIAGAVVLGLVMLVAAFVLATTVSVGFTALLLLYTVTTLAYSIRLKRLALIDVLVLSALYTLRIGAGAVATGVDLSNWLLAISIFLFLSLALVKRCAELEELVDDSRVLAPGRGYQAGDLPSLRAMGLSAGFLAVLVLALYIDSQNSRALYAHPDWLWAAAPLLLLWLMRIWLKTGRRELVGEDPLQFALRDRFSWLTLIGMGLIGGLATHGLPIAV